MTIVHRRLLYLSFILVFVVVGPLITLYATGYRYNTRLGTVQKTGAVMIDATPRDVLVHLDGNHIEDPDVSDQSIRLTRLTPKEYEITISRDGYHDWKVVTDVGPSESVFFPNVHLFRNNTLPVFTEDVVVPERPFAEVGATARLRSADISIKPGRTRDEIVREKTATADEVVIGTIPHASYAFYEAPSGWVVVRDTSAQTLYLYHVNNDLEVDRRHVIPEVVDFAWSPDERSLLYFNAFELWILDVETGSEHLVTRRSSGIDAAHWYPGGGYVLYQTDDTVRVQEIADRQYLVSHELIDLPGITSMQIDPDGTILYLEARVGSQEGWFTLQIQ